MRAILMLSGGLDSATCAALAQEQGHEVVALSFDYGQRHASELQAARRVAEHLNIKDHRVVQLNLTTIGGSALTDTSIDVPKDAQAPDAIPVTYVPARNTVFLSIALGLAEVSNAHIIYFGANALDYSGYPDCRPEFVDAFTQLANVATKASAEGTRYEIRAPLLDLKKADIIKEATRLGVDLSLTQSCYDPDEEGRACGHCDSCLLRKRGFEEAGIEDVTRYR